MAKFILMAICLFGGLLVLSVTLYLWLGGTGLLIALAVALALGFWLKLIAGRLFKALVMTPFKLKGAVLRGAAVSVHSLLEASGLPEPRRGEEMDDETWEELQAGHADRLAKRDGSERFYELELSISPQPVSGEGFRLWEPGELSLAEPGLSGEALLEADPLGELEEVLIWHEGAWQSDEGLKYEGPQRLRLTFAVPAELGRARLRYYFEVLGEELNFAAAQPA